MARAEDAAMKLAGSARGGGRHGNGEPDPMPGVRPVDATCLKHRWLMDETAETAREAARDAVGLLRSDARHLDQRDIERLPGLISRACYAVDCSSRLFPEAIAAQAAYRSQRHAWFRRPDGSRLRASSDALVEVKERLTEAAGELATLREQLKKQIPLTDFDAMNEIGETPHIAGTTPATTTRKPRHGSPLL